jgi:histidyl-tRNA synthetase
MYNLASEETSGVGSIAAGGRYDELVGMFSNGKKIPCVGVSIGVERVFAIMLAKSKSKSAKSRASNTQVYIIGLGSGYIRERLALAKLLWDAGLSVEYRAKEKPRMDQEFKFVKENAIPVSVVVDFGKNGDGVYQIENNVTGDKLTANIETVVDEIKKQF